jgi:hypothetical protein
VVGSLLPVLSGDDAGLFLIDMWFEGFRDGDEIDATVAFLGTEIMGPMISVLI